MTRIWVLLLCATAGGCATSSNHATDKVLGYTDHDHFVIEHHDPAHGGRIIGTVCAVDIQLDARQQRGGVRLVGEAADRHETTEGMYRERRAWVPAGGQALPMLLETRDREGERDITGTVGERRFDLHARGDDYVGSLQIADARMPFVLRGAEQMWAMPAAAQAAILPLLLSCTAQTKVIQIVDLRSSETPPAAPPLWLAPQKPYRIVDPAPSLREVNPRDAGPGPRQTPMQRGSV